MKCVLMEPQWQGVKTSPAVTPRCPESRGGGGGAGREKKKKGGGGKGKGGVKYEGLAASQKGRALLQLLLSAPRSSLRKAL